MSDEDNAGEPERPIEVPIQSSAIAFARYDPSTRELDLTFKSRQVYTLRGVPKSVFERFLISRSKGKFFNEELKGRYG